MKKYFLCFFLVLAIITLKAQPLPGKYVLKGSTDLAGLFLSTDYKGGSNTTQVNKTKINIQPSAGAFITHHIFIGVYTGYEYQKESIDKSYNKSNEFLIGPYLRGYIGDSKFIPFFHINVGYSNLRLKQDDDDSSLNLDGVDYGFGIGVEYFFERKFTFEFILSYDGTKFTSDEYSTNAFGITSSDIVIHEKGFGFRFGTSFFLN